MNDIDAMKKRVGRALAHYRDRAGLSQEALGLDVGLSRPTIHRIEVGQSWPEIENLDAIAKRLGVPLSAFFDAEPVTVEPTPEESLKVLARFVAQSRVKKT